jgi:hypothetical protein
VYVFREGTGRVTQGSDGAEAIRVIVARGGTDRADSVVPKIFWKNWESKCWGCQENPCRGTAQTKHDRRDAELILEAAGGKTLSGNLKA